MTHLMDPNTIPPQSPDEMRLNILESEKKLERYSSGISVVRLPYPVCSTQSSHLGQLRLTAILRVPMALLPAVCASHVACPITARPAKSKARLSTLSDTARFLGVSKVAR